MPQSLLVRVLLITCLVMLVGCHLSVGAGLGKKRTNTTATQTDSDKISPTSGHAVEARPAIPGDWSETVNGIRMMTQLVETADAGPEQMRAVLVFTVNVSDRPISVPPIQAEARAHRRRDGRDLMELPDTINNLRIIAEDLDPHRIAHVHPPKYEELQSAREAVRDLEPGEIRVHVIYLMLDHTRLSEAIRQLRRMDVVTSSALTWDTHLGLPGAYRLHMTYRPYGFCGEESDSFLEIDSYQDWQGKEIVLPPITIELFEDEFDDAPLQKN